MKLFKVANSKKDEYYTPLYAVKPIFEYIPNNKTIWCPFDTKESWFVKYGKLQGHNIIHTHIQDGIDFFNCEVPDCDLIVSNPPYSCKGEVLQRLFDIEKPFAMLLGVLGLFDSQKRFNMFKNNQFEILYLNKRVAYFTDYTDQKPCLNPPFSSAYICSNLLPKQICFKELESEVNNDR